MFVGCRGGGEVGREKPLKATFTARLGCRCIDRVAIMVQWGGGGVDCVDKFYGGGGGQVTKGAGAGFGIGVI